MEIVSHLTEDDESFSNDIAVIGMAGHLPGAVDPDELWSAVEAGRDCLSELTVDDAVQRGVSRHLASDPNYVLRDGALSDVAGFDYEFFGIGQRDAAIMDPQHRHFIECLWEAIESAGHTPEGFDGQIGVFAGCGMNTYLLHNLLTNPDLVEQMGWFLLRHTANDKDFLSTTASYHLGLEGPSVNIQTACSTSLVAVHLAAQSLLGFECDMAVAGGSTIEFPHGSGYLYREGEVLAPDGVCRAYDQGSGGTVLTSGTAVVTLRRLEDALDDGDPVLAVIKGSAINNDGRRKVSYLAPSVDGHTDVVREALRVADVNARSIGLLEGHGTGTALGDPIEVSALTEAFRADTTDTGFCRLTSTKPNIGHLDTAAGTASLIKVVQALRHRVLPPIANHSGPSEMLDLDRTPFVLSGKAEPWISDGPRLAGVSSLGVGGTNAHLVIEEAPVQAPEAPGQGPVALLVSGTNRAAVSDSSNRLADFLEREDEPDLHSVANTLATGRRAMAARRVVIAESVEEAVERLRTTDRASSHTNVLEDEQPVPNIVFLFPGGGSQYPGMTAGLGSEFETFTEIMAAGATYVAEIGGPDLTALLEPDVDPTELQRTTASLPAVFLTSVALARQWMAWGVEPSAMLGHSLGEYTAAHLAGVLSLEDALKLVVARSSLIDRISGKSASMAVIPLSEAELVPMLDEQLSLATVNAADECVVAGPAELVEELAGQIEERGLEPIRIPLAAAGHSSMLDPVLDEFLAVVKEVSLSDPTRRYVSNLTGTWITPEQATSPQYWVDHLRHTVQFLSGLETVQAEGPTVFIELGPGHSLASYARRLASPPVDAISVLRHPNHVCDDATYLRLAFARQWTCGLDTDLGPWTGAGRRRMRLPTYPFQREHCWIEPGTGSAIGPSGDQATNEPSLPARIENVEDMYWRPIWEPAPALTDKGEPTKWYLIGSDTAADPLVAALRQRGHETVVAADARALDPEQHRHVILVPPDDDRSFASASDHWVQCAGDAAKKLAESNEPATLVAITTGAMGVNATATNPLDAMALGVVGVVAKEYPQITGHLIDADPDTPAVEQMQALCDEIERSPATIVALRNGERLTRGTSPAPIDPEAAAVSAFKPGATYLVTGGLGGIGYELASYLAESCGCNLVVTSSAPLPTGKEAQEWLASHGYNDPTSRRLRRLEALRTMTKVEAIHLDLEQAVDLSTTLDHSESLVGPIEGAIHAAGRLRDRLLAFAEPEDHEIVLGAKAFGATALLDDLQRRGTKFLVLVSSTSTLLCPEGQSSYVAANAVLDSLAGNRGGVNVCTLSYGVWSGVGLAAETARRIRLGLDDGDPVVHPIFDRKIVERDGSLSVVGALETRHNWVVDEHRTSEGQAVLPGTGQLELLLAAVRLAGLDRHRLDAVTLFDAVTVPDESVVTVRVTIAGEPQTESSLRTIRLESDRGTGHWTLHAEAELVPLVEAPQDLNITTITNRINLDFDPLETLRSSLQIGPHWDAIDEATIGDGEAFATMKLAKPQEASWWDAHPALVDLATAVGAGLSQVDGSRLHVPIGYGQVRSHGPIPIEAVIHAQRRKDSTQDVLQVDLAIADQTGAVALEIQALQLRPLDDLSAFAEQSIESSPSQPLPPLLAMAERHGITGTEGAAMLERAATEPSNRIIGSSIALDDLRIPLHPESEPIGLSATGGSLSASSAEQALAEIWAQLLGLTTIDHDADFFDLGGHSLLAIRLMSQIHQTLGVRFQLATIFEASTIAGLANLVREQRPDIDEILSSDSNDDAVVPAPVAVDQEPPPCLVPISRKGEGQPLFIVHGAGGNILFLSSLARAMPEDRPIYGFQARGINQGDLPDPTVEAMADRYVAELTAAHSGPFLLGGYSGGGQVALEMIPRLEAAGHEVTGIVLFDSVPAGKAFVERSDRWRNLASHVRHQGAQSLLPYARQRLIETIRPLFSSRQSDKEEFDRATSLELGYNDTHNESVNLFFYFSASANRHETGTYDVDAIVLQADEQWPIQPADYHWNKHIRGRLIFRQVPGDHHTMFFPKNAPILVEQLRSALSELESE